MLVNITRKVVKIQVKVQHEFYLGAIRPRIHGDVHSFVQSAVFNFRRNRLFCKYNTLRYPVMK